MDDRKTGIEERRCKGEDRGWLGRGRKRVIALRRSGTFFVVTIVENGGKDCTHMLNCHRRDVIKGIGRPVASKTRGRVRIELHFTVVQTSKDNLTLII